MELSRTAHVILGMLALGKRTGYEIKQLVDVSTRFFWAASYGQIYPELARLEEAGLVSATGKSADGRRRKEYELTAGGGRALRDWLTSDAPLHLELRHEGLLKLFFADSLSAGERLDLLRRIRSEHERIAAALRAVEPGARAASEQGRHRHGIHVLELGLAYQELFVDWTRELERQA